MNPVDDVTHWAHRFGLAIMPLFEHEKILWPGSHSVLLDGALGSFAMSVSEEELWRNPDPANWIWSSDIPHHVTITPSIVAVLRWDRPHEARVFKRESIERNLEGFYAFLNDDRLRSNRSVVEYLLNFFRRLRTLAHAAGVPDIRATDVFTASLARLIGGSVGSISPSEYGLADDATELLTRLDYRGLQAAIQEIEQGAGTLSWLKLHPALAVRHASGQLFQEAHFELLRGATDFDLFGLVGTSEVATTSRGGAHFTPATLARSLLERALECISEPLNQRSELTLCDPACGSGAFLHEALRALRRLGFKGHLRLVGHDISPAAIAMARFAVAASLRDWAPEGGVELELRIGDSLGDLGIPEADVVVMNPPFIGFATQTHVQREQLTTVLGSSTAGRGDYSMVFVLRALQALKSGGVMGTLFPASLLSLKAASVWRNRLLDLADLRLLASIGDFGLFAHAQVQVAAAVFSKDHVLNRELIALITENDPQATSVALRELRRASPEPVLTAVVDRNWSLFPVPVSALRDRPTWRLPTPRAERLLTALAQAGLPSVGDLFDVAQGIQTGLNSALLLTTDELNSLPAKERRYFRQATMTDSIQNGRIVKVYWLFFPHHANDEIFTDEDAVRKSVPRYFARFLEPNRSKLEGRASIVSSRRSDWWGLMRAREWSSSDRPRIISKFFGAEGAFVGDYSASYYAVMGHVWTLKQRDKSGLSDSDEEANAEQLSEQDLLSAYVGLCNSEVFVRLLSLYAPNVAGGQFDLSARHVTPVLVPDLQTRSLGLESGRFVRELGTLGREVNVTSAEWRQKVTSAVEALYGGINLDALRA
jgi:adenine-specific DNA-methyltransferase